jgi:hypothetical protein
MKEGIKMSYFDHQWYFPIAKGCNVIPYYNELVDLQEQRLDRKRTALRNQLSGGSHPGRVLNKNTVNVSDEINNS